MKRRLLVVNLLTQHEQFIESIAKTEWLLPG